MPRHGENIRKRKDGRWEGRYIPQWPISGKTKYISVYGTSYAKVKSKLDVQKSRKEITPAKDIDVARLCAEWLEDVQITVKDSSYAHFYEAVHKHILPQIGTIKLKGLTNDVIKGFIKQKTINGRLDGRGGLSAKTTNDLASLLIQIIQFAEKRQYMTKFDYDISLPKTISGKLPVLTPTEREKLENYIIKKPNMGKIGVLIALYTGIRLGELCALKWQDIDFDTGILSITKTLQRIKNTNKDTDTRTIIIIDTPKSEKSIRDIPIPSSLMNILGKYRDKNSLDSYILSGSRKYTEPRNLQAKFKRYLKGAGIQDINFHSTRHTFATVAIEKGFDIKSLSEILGHSSVRFTLERYVHSSHEQKKASMEKLTFSH